MGQMCSRGGGVAEDAKSFPTDRKKRERGKSKDKVNSDSNKTEVAPDVTANDVHGTRAEKPVEGKVPTAEEFTVITQIEALQHTMRPTVPVVGRGDLHPDFRQFTPIFPADYAALTVVSCREAKLPQQVLIAGEDCSIAQFNYETGHVMRRWVRAHDRDVNHLTRPTSTGLFVSCGRDCAVKVWNLNRDEPIAVLLGHTLNVVTTDIDATSTRVISGGIDSTVRLWDIATAQQLYCANRQQNVVTFVRDMAKLNLIAQGAEDLTIRLWDVRAPPATPALTLNNTMTDTDYIPLCCDVSPSAFSRLLTGHSGVNREGSVVQEWDARMGRSVRVYTGHQASVTSLRMCTAQLYGDTTFFTTSDDSTIGFWSLESDNSGVDVATLPIRHQFRVPEGPMTCCETEENGDIIVTLRSGSLVVFRPQREGDSILPGKRFRYVGPMDPNKSLSQ